MLRTDRLVIRQAGPEDIDALMAYRERNRAHLTPWEPLRDAAWETREAWEARLATARDDADAGRAFSFVGRLEEKDKIVATATLSNVLRGVFQACHLGYSVDASHEGQGLMREMLEAVIDYAFMELQLHRVMANHLPQNEKSAGLLKRLGFEREGYARDYLLIGGHWRDHVLTAKINPRH